jgi:uncharacterized protein (TIGR03067 family)
MQATLLLGAALTLGAPALKDKTPPAPSLVGEWVIEQATVGGQGPGVNPNPNRWVFRADGTHSILDSGGKSLSEGLYQAEPKAGSIDLDSSGMPPAVPYLCIYKMDGDTLVLNVGWQKAPRPVAFESPMGSQCTLYVMKRVKEK